MFQSSIAMAGAGTFERLVAGLQAEFGTAAAAGLVRQFIEAEDADFYWEARAAERWLGTYESLESDEEMLDRIAIMGELGGQNFVAVMIVAERTYVEAMLGLRLFGSAAEAREPFEFAH